MECFGGIGACSKALKNLNIDYEIADYVEIDKFAVKSFNAIFGTNFEPQDICEWNKQIDVDLIMHGSPCQDFSLAGKQAGGDEGSGTRSSLMYETIRIVEKLKPKYVIWENVKNVISKKHRHNFDNYLNKMEELGYKNYWQVLNAKDYGIPQNRERVFTISILGNEIFEFPPKQELKLKLKDMLESNVDEKYYLSEEITNKIKYKFNNENDLLGGMQEHQSIKKDGICTTLTSSMGCGGGYVPIVSRKYGVFDDENLTHQAGSVYDENGLSPTLDTMQGGNRQPKIVTHTIKQKVKVRKYKVDIENLKKTLKEHKKYSNKEISEKLNVPITTVEHWFRNDKSFSIPDANIWHQLKKLLNIQINEFDESITTFIEKDNVYEKSNRCYFDDGVAPTLTATSSDEKIISNLRIRKLTPKECWRLMGFDDEDFERAEKVNSNTQLYKQAGNSICVSVLEAILLNLLK